MMTFVFSATVLLALAGPDPVIESAAQPAPKVQAVQGREPSMEQRYCVLQAITGSRIPKKECRTRAEWIARTGVDPAGEARK